MPQSSDQWYSRRFLGAPVWLWGALGGSFAALWIKPKDWDVDSKSIDALHPEFQPLAERWIERIEAKGYDFVTSWRSSDFPRPRPVVYLTGTRRSLATQKKKFDQGYSKVKLGYHNVGLALDFNVVPAGSKPFFPKQGKTSATKLEAWRRGMKEVGEVGEALGMTWGGSWRRAWHGLGWDAPHLEWHPGIRSIADAYQRQTREGPAFAIQRP